MSNFKNLYEQLERMVDLINYNSGDYYEDDYFVIYEGLIKTQSPKLAKNLLERMFLTVGYGKNIFSTRLKIGPVTTQPKIETHPDGTLIVSFLPLRNDIEDAKHILAYINNLGYFLTVIDYKEKRKLNLKKVSYNEEFLFELIKKYDFLEQFDVTIEAKFDVELDKDKISDKLYHITRQDVLHKIKKIGLTPRTKSKKSTHTERVYFAKTYEDAYDIYVQFKKGYSDQKYAILEINPKLVNYLRLFDDPNFKGYGYYGLVNVPPSAIKILKENL